MSGEADVIYRPMRLDDFAVVHKIEVSANRIFADIGMDAVAAMNPMTDTELQAAVRTGSAWVAALADEPCGFIALSLEGQEAHIEQLSVHPQLQRRGMGRQLLAIAEDWACTRGLDWLTLTTFEDVAWNAPYYRALGFEVVPAGALSGHLLRAMEASKDQPWARAGRRVAMRRRVRRKFSRS